MSETLMQLATLYTEKTGITDTGQTVLDVTISIQQSVKYKIQKRTWKYQVQSLLTSVLG